VLAPVTGPVTVLVTAVVHVGVGLVVIVVEGNVVEPMIVENVMVVLVESVVDVAIVDEDKIVSVTDWRTCRNCQVSRRYSLAELRPPKRIM
jgi:hypothetical protein